MNGLRALYGGLVTPVTLCVLLACGGTPRVNDAPMAPATVANVYLGAEPVYGILEPGSDGSWVFSSLTAEDPGSEHGFVIRLNDLAPAFDTRIAECEPQAYPLNHKCNPSHPFRNREVGVVSRIVNAGIAAGTAGQITDVNRTYKTAFDEAKLNKAVDEALINSNLKQQRRAFFALLDRYEGTLQSRTVELGKMYSTALSRYEQGARSSIVPVPELGGLTEYYSHDIDFAELITVRARRPGERPALALAPEEPILPCAPRGCLEKLETALSDLNLSFQRAQAEIAAELATTIASYAISCEATQHSGYHFTLQCPSEIIRNKQAPQPVPVRMTLLSRDFVDLYPEFELGDARLAARSDGATLELRNLTPAYLTVSAATLYYNSQLNTVPVSITLAPLATHSMPLQALASPALAVEARYLDMTPDKAARANYSHGLAVKYELTGEGVERTLHRVAAFNVACTIDNRLAPGSCPSGAAARSTEPPSEPALEQAPRGNDAARVGQP